VKGVLKFIVKKHILCKLALLFRPKKSSARNNALYNITDIVLTFSNITDIELIDWLLFNTNFSSISVILWSV